MMDSINRRDFLKILASLPLMKLVGDVAARGYALRAAADTNIPNVIIVVFDALSALNMSLYGYPRETTPNIKKLADISTVFNRHYAGGNFTSPGTASILTGTYPWTHRAFHLYGTVTNDYVDKNIFHGASGEEYERIAFTHNDLASILLYQFGDDIDLQKAMKDLSLFNENLLTDSLFKEDHNAAFLGERMIERGQRGQDVQLPTSLFLSIVHRYWRDKEKRLTNSAYRKSFPRGLPSTNAQPFLYLLEDSIDWTQNVISTSNEAFFGYFHFMPPHEPYNARKEYVDMFKDDGWTPPRKPEHIFSQGNSQKFMNSQRREYDEYIAYVDGEFGRLVDFMQNEGLLENTYLVLTSDHGEMFERGIIEHITETLFEPITRVPLLIHKPGQTERVDVHTPTNNVDLLPTIYHAIGTPLPEWSEGVVLPTFSANPVDEDRSIYVVEAKSNPKNAPLKRGTVALIKGQYKLIHYFGYQKAKDDYEFYDLENDPEEMNDLYPTQSSLVKEYQAELLAKIEEVNQPYQIE